jgi:hypothetical protein
MYTFFFFFLRVCANSVPSTIVLLLLVYFPLELALERVGPTHTGFHRTTPSDLRPDQDDHDDEIDRHSESIMAVGVVTLPLYVPAAAPPSLLRHVWLSR